MEELKQHPSLQGLNGFSHFWSNSIASAGAFFRKIHLSVRLHWRRILMISLILAGLTVVEVKTSFIEARCFTWLAGKSSFTVQPGHNTSLRFPADGPYDQRLGYARLPDFIKSLNAQGYQVELQARASSSLNAITRMGLNPAYHEKTQAGLGIFAHDGTELFKARYPQRVCDRFESLSPLIVNTLLFIENRELLDFSHSYRNPAVEWDRLAKAVLDRSIHFFNPDHSFAGGSTLPTQIEKFRHSPEGRTTGATEKIKQIISASIRAYRQGRDTQAVRRQLVVDYINSVPFAAFPGYGEVHGIGDALWVVYGVDFKQVNDLLNSGYEQADEQRAEAYKQILSLFIAQRRPSYYLVSDRDALEPDTNAHLRVLCSAGVIPQSLRDEALGVKLRFLDSPPDMPSVSYVNRKAANTVRRQLMSALNLPLLYDLDRLDLSVKTTLNGETQNKVSNFLTRLRDPDYTKAAGLHGYHLLGNGDPERIIYSFTLYEHVGNANLLRVQTDNFDQPFDINEGVKMELGSTAKLRTLVTYLELVAGLHERYSGLTPQKLRQVYVDPHDRLTRWALDYLLAVNNPSLVAMLQASMERRYPADPEEIFFTGGGQHKFHNFDREDNPKILTVNEGFRKSVNLVFIRLMRDIVYTTICLKTGAPSKILDNENNPSRPEYLKRFADQEGRVFLNRFYNKYRGKSSADQLALLLDELIPSPVRLAALYRFIEPAASVSDFAAFLKSRLPAHTLKPKDIEKLYSDHGPEKWDLRDRGYITRLHPLELWLVAYLKAHPSANRAEVTAASEDQRQQIYSWLFKPAKKSGQNTRIRTILEADAFMEIAKTWKKTGYPFETLVPSYATAIGSSADRPSALAELIGIILNSGVRYPVTKIEALHFASQTPYETLVRRKTVEGQQVMSPEIATVLREALTDVVEKGTAQSIRKAFVAPNGVPLRIGGKTGTGDNRYETVDRNGQILESRVINRAAVFAFFIGDRFFGTITALVPGPEAANYDYTSSLPVRILKLMAPKLLPMFEQAESHATSAFKAPPGPSPSI